MSELPPGFVLDSGAAGAPQPAPPGLPAGFQLDAAPSPSTQAPAAGAGPHWPSLSSVLNGMMNGASETGQGIVNSAVSGATLPRDVYQGKVETTPSRMSAEEGQRVVDLLGFANPATPASRSQLAVAPAAIAPTAAGDAAELGIGLTAGQRTADPALLSTENAMLGGGKGAPAQRVAQDAAQAQQQQVLAARDAIGETAGRGQADLARAADAGDAAAQGVRQAASEAKVGYQQKYDTASALPGEFKPEALQGVRGRIEQGLTQRETPVIVDPVLTPSATRALGELDNIGNLKLGINGQPGAGEEIVGVNLKGVDQARRRLNAYRNAASTPEDKRAVGAVIGEFDGQIQNALENGLFSGSDKALDAWKDARAAFASYQKTFKPQGAGDDVGRSLQAIIERDASPEQVANYLYGSTKIGATGLSVRMADRLKGVLGEASPEWAAIRQGAWQRLTGVAEGKTEMGAQKMSERILEFVNGDGKSLATRLFSDDELAQMRRFANVQKAIAAKPGTTNPSNSGNRLAALARESLSAVSGMLGATAGGPLGAGVGYIAGRGLKAISDVRAAGQARQLFSGEAPVSIGRRLAAAQGGTQRLIAPRAAVPALQGAASNAGTLRLLQGPVPARAQDEQR